MNDSHSFVRSKLRLFFLCLFLSANFISFPQQSQSSSVGQTSPPNIVDSKIKAIYIYTFTRYFEWTEQSALKDFRIGLLGADTNLINVLNKLAEFKKVGNRPLQIKIFNSPTEVSDVEIIYVDAKKYPDFILDKSFKNTLVISENGRNLYNTMISFVRQDNKWKFALNKYTIKNSNLKMSPELEKLAYVVLSEEDGRGVTPTKWDELLNKLESSKENDSKTITLTKEEVEQMLGKYSEQNVDLASKDQSIELKAKEIERHKQSILAQERRIDEQLADIEKQQVRLQEVNQNLNQTTRENSIQKEALNTRKQELLLQQRRIREQKEVLEKQKQDIEGQRRTLMTQLEKINTQQLILWMSLCFVVIIIFFLTLVYRNYKKIKSVNLLLEKQKMEITAQHLAITNQKHLIEEKHREITDSINYAERIQRTFMATKELLNENLKDYFVFFQPKDVVSGDFYWASALNNGHFALVTADSTGHGVPGAIMSLLNIASIEKSVEKEIEPAEILNSTRKIIIERLKKDGSAEGGKDGMDCSFISFDFKNKKLVYAAAHNPVWIVRPVISSSDKGAYREMINENSSRYEQSSTRTDSASELIELEPDKMPVGKHDHDSISFSQKSVDLKKGDVIYTLTDGFPDQFGGPKGKKFMYKKLKELLVSIAHKPMDEQRKILSDTFKDWKGDSEQVDDVCVIGVRV